MNHFNKKAGNFFIKSTLYMLQEKLKWIRRSK